MDVNGASTVSVHQLRHTLGTQLAEGAARIQTIMSIPGHKSATRSMIYSRISDPEVQRNSKQRLGRKASYRRPQGAAAHGFRGFVAGVSGHRLHHYWAAGQDLP